MYFRRWLAVVMVLVGVLAHFQPASAADAHGFSTVLRVNTSSPLTFPFMYPSAPQGGLAVTNTISCVDVGARVGASAQANAGQCTVSFSGSYYSGATCVYAAGDGRGSVTTTAGTYEFAAVFELQAGTMTFEGTISRGAETGTIVGSGPLTSDPNSGTSCYHATTTEYWWAGTFTFAID